MKNERHGSPPALRSISCGYLALHLWLAGFTYHVELSWWIFPTAGVAALGIALVTVSYQSVRAARADPVVALRYE